MLERLAPIVDKITVGSLLIWGNFAYFVTHENEASFILFCLDSSKEYVSNKRDINIAYFLNKIEIYNEE